MTWLPMIDPKFQKVKLWGEVYYGEEAVINIPATSVNDRFREITAGLIARVTSKTPPRKAPSESVEENNTRIHCLHSPRAKNLQRSNNAAGSTRQLTSLHNTS